MMPKVAAKEKENLRALVRAEVNSALWEVLSDPEYTLPLRKSFVRKLEQSRRNRAAGKVYSLEEVKRRLRL